MQAAAVAASMFLSSPLQAQTAQRPAQGQKPAPQRPAPTTKPPTTTAKPPATTAKPPAPATAKPAEPAPPPKPVAQDLRLKTAYTTAGQKTESVTYKKGLRERFEFGDVIVIKQYDLKRTLQVMTAANSYMVVPDGGMPGVPAPAAPGAAPQTPGVVLVTTTITDTGERKPIFGLQARHVKTVIDKAPSGPGCDPSKQHIETDGWYVDLPAATQAVPDTTPPPGCVDQVKATLNGDPKVLGFPISYSTTIVGEDGKPNVVAMEISELEITTLDAALFDAPAGMMEMGNLQALTKAVSDSNETKLAASLTAAAPPVEKTPGVALVGVPEIVNKTAQQVDTRALRDRLVTELAELKLNAAPLAAGQTDLAQQAGAHGYDYVLTAEITDLKVSKPGGGGIGGILRGAASKATGAAAPTADPAEATIAIKLVQPDGKNRYSTNAKGKTGGGAFDVKSMAKSLGSNYVNMMTGRFMMNALNKSMAKNLGGMGMLNDPNLLNMQVQGMNLGPQGGLRGLGLDPTARAASFLMQQSAAAGALTSGVLGAQAPSLEEALADALKSAAKSVSDNLKKK
jgi:hypothetical protein